MGGFYINSIISSLLLLMMILADYLSRYETDGFQRRLYVGVIIPVLIAVASDFIHMIFEGRPGRTAHYVLYAANTLYLIFQIAAYYLIVVFIDYEANKNRDRTLKFLRFVGVILVFNTLALVFNFSRGYYFYISEDNRYVFGNLYGIRLVVSYAPVLIGVVDLLMCRKNLKRSQIYLIIFFALLTGSGAALDIVLGTGNLIWPCLSAALLYLYFFIVRRESKIDSLTGIDNRYSFNEFMNNLAGQDEKDAYALAMIDLDEFKKINDTFGHLEGDNALRDTAAIIKGCIRHTDFAARYWGDEFVLAVRAEYNMEILMGRILEAIKNQNEKNVRPYKIKISYGCAVFTPQSGQSIESFLAHLDSLMYKHKAEQRGKP
jgi:diguanylate cyclase (GGDEF)-like protein